MDAELYHHVALVTTVLLEIYVVVKFWQIGRLAYKRHKEDLDNLIRKDSVSVYNRDSKIPKTFSEILEKHSKERVLFNGQGVDSVPEYLFIDLFIPTLGVFMAGFIWPVTFLSIPIVLLWKLSKKAIDQMLCAETQVKKRFIENPDLINEVLSNPGNHWHELAMQMKEAGTIEIDLSAGTAKVDGKQMKIKIKRSISIKKEKE